MLRILIVDDERIILNGIRIMIEEKLNLAFPVEVATATSVRLALEKLETFQADLILTDIRMPVRDGFELIRQVRERDLACSIVILTSHADFQYAQQAIRFQVTDFILKPIDQQLLKDTIERVWRQKEEQERKFLRFALAEVGNMMLYDLSVRELTSEPETIEQLFPYAYITVIVIVTSWVEAAWGDFLEKILLQHYKCCYCFVQQERGQLIAICNHELIEYQLKPAAFEEEIRKFIREKFWTGISISSDTYRMLHSLYQNAIQRIFYTKYFGKDSKLTGISTLTYQECVRIFLEDDVEEARRILEEYLNLTRVITDQHSAPEEIYRSFFHNIMLYLENCRIPVPKHLLGDPGAMEYEQLLPMIMNRLCQLKKQLRSDQPYRDEELVKKILKYIKQHYREDMSLETLAEFVGYNASYISTVFKKKIGLSYLECIHRERLQAAKKLLLETDYTMDYIADEVGYGSATHFAKVFRKYENVSPSTWRNRGKAGSP